MTHSFRIAPKQPLIIEWQAHLPGAQWGFYRVCDSPNDAKRSLAVLCRPQWPNKLMPSTQLVLTEEKE